MTDKKDGPGKGPGSPESQGAKRPFATIDLKATEVKIDEVKAKQAETRTQSASAPAAGSTGPEQAAAATVAAAAKVAGDALRQPAAAGPAKPAEKPGAKAGTSNWSVESAIGERASASRAVESQSAARSGGFARFLSHMAAGIIGGILALAGSEHIFSRLGQPPTQPPPAAAPPPDIAGRLASLEKTMRERLVAAESPKPNPALEAGLARVETLAKQSAAMAEAQTRIAAETEALKQALAARPAASADAERLAKLEEQLATIVQAAAADPNRAGRIPQIAGLVGQVRDLETAVNTRLGTLRKDLTQDIDNRFAAAAETIETSKSATQRIDREVTGLKSEATRLTERAAQLKTASDRLDEGLKVTREETAALKSALEGLKGDVDARFKAAAKPADIASAVAPLSQKLGQLEQSLQGLVRAEDDRKSNAERIVLSLELANLKRAMERGARYGAELAEVRRVAGDRVDLKPLERYQSEGVPTLPTLAQDFKKVANAIVDAEAEQPGASVVDRMLTSAKSIVRVRKSEYAADDNSAEAVVTRMEAALKDARLGEVLAESKKLSDKARTPALDWLRKVEARQTVDAALATIETALKTSLGAGAKTEAPKGTKQ